MGSNPVWRIDLQTRFHVSANEAEGPGGTLTLPAVESPRVQRCIEFLALPQQAHPATKADDSASYRAGADNCAAIGTSP